MLRCLTMRSSSRRNASYFSARVTRTSSRNRRRPPGPSFTTARSSGENTVTRMTPSRSRARAELLTIDQHPVATVAAELQLDQHLAAVVVHHRGANDCCVGADADHRIERCAAKAVERGKVGHRLGEVGLALTVEPDDCRGARLEVERRVRVVTKVDPARATLDDHAAATQPPEGAANATPSTRHPHRHQQVQVVVVADSADDRRLQRHRVSTA